VVAAPAAGPVATAPVAEMEVVRKETVIRDISPSRYSTTTGTTAPVIVDSREYRDVSAPLVYRPRSLSRSGRRDLRPEIRALEDEMVTRKRGSSRGDIVRAERLSDGQLVLYEERVEKVEEGRRGPRIEKDRKGRMSISVPKHH